MAVDVGNLLQLYASMLFERRILLFASKLSTVRHIFNIHKNPSEDAKQARRRQNSVRHWLPSVSSRPVCCCCSKIVSALCCVQLTSCVHALSAVIYPMYWQHIFIPVLPPHLLDYCWYDSRLLFLSLSACLSGFSRIHQSLFGYSAPMPYLIGVHTSLSEVNHTHTLLSQL